MSKDLFDLSGRVAIVTGASSGLGVTFAETLAEAGAHVVICARRLQKLEETGRKVRELGARCLVVQTDVTKGPSRSTTSSNAPWRPSAKSTSL